MAQRAISKDTDIVGLTCDSRLVEPGFLFAALAGARADGRAFIPEAMARGAAAVLAPPGTRIETREPPVPLLVDEGVIILLDKPENERAEEIRQQPQEMAKHCKILRVLRYLLRLFGDRRRGAGIGLLRGWRCKIFFPL